MNGELFETNFIDEQTLLVLDVQIADGDTVDVAIRSNSSTHKVLTRTQKYYYQEADVVPQEGINATEENLGDTGAEEGTDALEKKTPEENSESVVKPAKLIPIPQEPEEETDADAETDVDTDPSGNMTDKSNE